MKKQLLGITFVSAILLSAFVRAEAAQILENSNLSPREQIIEWAKTATPVKYSDISDSVYNGTCFNDNGGRKALAGLVALEKNDPTGGPAFPGEDKIFLLSLNSPLRNSIAAKNYVLQNWSVAKTVIAQGGLAEWRQNNIHGQIYRHGEYLMTVAYSDSEVTCDSDYVGICKSGEKIPPNTAFAACYYYEQIP